MDRKNTYLVGALVIIAVVGFAYVFLRSATRPSSTSDASAISTTTTTYAFDSVITAKHAYRNGEHILAGSVTLPTPCHLLENTVTILPDESRATIAFTRTFSGGECPGGPVDGNFLVRFKGKPTTEIRATIDGREVVLSLIEATSSEDIESAPVFLKG